MSKNHKRYVLLTIALALTSIMLLLQELKGGSAYSELKTTAVSPPQPYLVKDIYEGSGNSAAGMQFSLITFKDDLYFRAIDQVHGEELWKTDGTVTNTVLLKDISPGTASSFFVSSAIITDNLYFSGSGISQFAALWRTDGTEAGTKIIHEFSGSAPTYFTAVDDKLFFSVSFGQLWISDGTITGTKILQAFNQGGNLSYLTGFNHMVFFSAYEGQEFVDTEFGFELWRSDGTVTGTVRVKDIYPGTAGDPSPAYLTVVDDKLFFVATDPDHGRELWVTDGTEQGTNLVKDINPSGNSLPIDLTQVNGRLFFVADDGSNGQELWVSDGTENGTFMLKDINPSGDSYPIRFVETNGLLYFVADDGIHGQEIWVSDGTESGTLLVKDINPAGDSTTIFQTTQFGALGLYFISLDDGVHGVEWWRSDGTPEGTYMIGDINPTGDGVDSFPGEPGYANGRFLFAARDDGTVGNELWALDIAQKDYEIDPNATSAQTITTFDNVVTLTIPPNALPADARYIKYMDGGLLNISPPPSNMSILFSLTLLNENGEVIEKPQFDPPLTAVIPYDSAQISSEIAELLLRVQFYNSDTGSWEKIPIKSIDTENQLITVELSHFTAFSVVEPETIYSSFIPLIYR